MITSEQLYLDYYNNWLTVEAMAGYYKVTKSWMNRQINRGRKLNHRRP